MAIVFQNSLTRKKEELIPALSGEINMYTCGVTVYDDCHVGHARSLFIFDCLKRYLEYRGYKVKLVRNITDVDDKIISRAKKENVEFENVRQKYIKRYEEDLAGLNIAKADFEPKATENIPFMIDVIKRLIEKGFAYESGGSVYFSVRAFPGYGKLSGQSPDEMLEAVRIEKDEQKKDPLDFALWKKSKEGEPFWQSPWGDGRPGWHIECSVMSMRYLKTETLDIHAGGRDLVFPHHENEIAQSEALTGKAFAKYWIHHGLLTIDGRKMSKSLGNFVTIQDILKRYSPDVLKAFFLSAHYASAIDFTFNALDNAKKSLEKFDEFLSKTASGRSKNRPQGRDRKNDIDILRKHFEEVMDDDFNTASGLAVLFEILNYGNKSLDAGLIDVARDAAGLIRELGGVLGISFKPMKQVLSSDGARVKILDSASLNKEEIERLVEERSEARKKKDFKKADEIRDHLKKHGVVIDDTGTMR